MTETIHDEKFLWREKDIAEIRSPQCETCIYRTGLFKCSEYSPIPRNVLTVEEPCPKYRKKSNEGKEVDK